MVIEKINLRNTADVSFFEHFDDLNRDMISIEDPSLNIKHFGDSSHHFMIPQYTG